MLCDLHTHSNHSDGTDTPAELMNRAEALGLGALALCDHNTVSGLPEFMNAAKGKRVQPVPGVEFSTEYQGKELHILGLFVRESSYAAITELVGKAWERKDQSNRMLIAKLAGLGYDIDYDAIAASTPEGHFNRATIAAALLEKGYVESISQACATLLSPERGLYVPPKRLDSLEVIAFIRSIGAVPVWAHPYLSVSPEWVEPFLGRAKEAGLAAMETRYSQYSPEIQAEAARLASKYGLLESGGSDYHGGNKPDIALGSGRGDLRVPLDFYEKLKQEAR